MNKPVLGRKSPVVGSSQELRPKTEFPEVVIEGSQVPSILHQDLCDVIIVTGERGKGKTTFCLGAEVPQNVLFLDYESKGSSLATQLPGITYFAPLEDCTRQFGIGFPKRTVWDRTVQIANAIPQDRFTTVIIDNGSWLQEGVAAMIEDDPAAWGVKASSVQTGAYGGPWPGVKKAIASFLTLLRDRGVKIILVTFQPTAAWANGVPSLNRLRVTNVTTWHERSTLTIALDSSAVGLPGVPSGLVLKESYARIAFVDGQMQVERRLPAQLPKATMAEVRRYLETPANFLNPAPGEVPDLDAVDRWRTTFGREQLAQFIKLLELSNTASETLTEETTEG